MILERDYPSETPDHRRLRDAIWSRLSGWRRFVIAVDGVDGVGKSTLARYLAWQLGMPVIESDLFLVRGTGRLEYRLDPLREVLGARLEEGRPVLFEGILALKALRMLGVAADFVVWVAQGDRHGSLSFQTPLAEYFAEFKPKEHADFLFRRAADE
jgi:hypothetical protein